MCTIIGFGLFSGIAMIASLFQLHEAAGDPRCAPAPAPAVALVVAQSRHL